MAKNLKVGDRVRIRHSYAEHRDGVVVRSACGVSRRVRIHWDATGPHEKTQSTAHESHLIRLRKKKALKASTLLRLIREEVCNARMREGLNHYRTGVALASWLESKAKEGAESKERSGRRTLDGYA